MTSPLGMLDYFAMEANEYIDRLRGLVDAPESPAAQELVRYARALRGAALMANQQPIARAANGLEGVARAVRDGQRGWDSTTKDLCYTAVEALAGFVKRSAQWTPADGQAADQGPRGARRRRGHAPPHPLHLRHRQSRGGRGPRCRRPGLPGP